MGEHQSRQLDGVFNALCDPTRRAILARLTDSDARVTEIAAGFPISLNSISKHIRMLERAGLLRRSIVGRDHVLSLNAGPLADAQAWIEKYRRFWEGRLAALEAYVTKKEFDLRKRETQMNAAVTQGLASAAVVVRRTIAASAEDLFDAWLDPEALAQWMRPGTINSTVARVEPRVGGAYEISMQGQAGPIVHKGVYRHIERPKRLVFTWISGPTENKETLVTVDFVRLDQRTEVVVTHEQLPESAMPSHRNGWTSGLEHLDEACQKGLI